jgi:hypothetical protein
MQLQNLFLALAAAATAQAGVIERQNACSSYTIINTRGTGEAQGPSAGFRTMNSNIQRQLPGGKVYNTVYAADASQNSAAGTADIVRKVQSTLSSNPNECFILEGYSQGAAATTNALPKLTGASFNAVKGVFLIGNPEHRSGPSTTLSSPFVEPIADVSSQACLATSTPTAAPLPRTSTACPTLSAVSPTTGSPRALTSATT